MSESSLTASLHTHLKNFLENNEDQHTTQPTTIDKNDSKDFVDEPLPTKAKQKKQPKVTKAVLSDGKLSLEKLPRPFVSELIQVYKSLKCLWDPQSPDYWNRKVKKAAWQKLIDKYREVVPKCNLNLIQRKISSLRSCFRKEYTKVERLKATWQPYKPRLWYYDQISFIVQVPPHKNAIYAMKKAGWVIKEELEEDVEVYEQDNQSSMEEECSQESNDYTDMADTIDISEFKIETAQSEECDPLRSENVIPENIESTETTKTRPLIVVKDQQDELHVTGQTIIAKLSTMEREQQIIAEKLIFEVLCYGRLGKLHMGTRLHNFENS